MNKLLYLWLLLLCAVCPADTYNTEDAADAAAISQDLGNIRLAATIVEKDGTRTEYIASANTDAARGNALELAIVALTADQRLEVAPGDFLMPHRGYILISGAEYKLNNSRIYIDGSSGLLPGSNSGLGIAIFYSATADAVSGWKFMGPGILDGGNVAGKRGLSPVNSTRCLIDGIEFQNFTGSGSAAFVPIDSSAPSVVGRRMSNCHFRNNLLSGYFAEAEYWMVSNCTFSLGSGQVGCDVSGGNNIFSSCQFQGGNLGTGFRVLNGGNEGHGVCSGCSFNHLSVGIHTAADVDSTAGQWLFSGCAVFSSGFDLNGKGIQYNGGFIANSTFVSTGANSGISHFYNVGTRSDSTQEATALAALSAVERAYLVFHNIRDEAGNRASWCDAATGPSLSVSGAGTAYTLTNSMAAVDFGTTDPTITIADTGKYNLYCTIQTTLTGATYAAAENVSARIRRTNNTAAYVSDLISQFLPAMTTVTKVGPSITIGPVAYDATAGDVLTIYAGVSVAPGAGSHTVTTATISAVPR